MTTTTFQTVLETFRDAATSNRDLGDKFERLIAKYLLTDPQYGDRLSDVWLWSEWPDRWGSDRGIDLVAREHATGYYWAIQCKFFLPTHSLQKGDIDSFFTESGRKFSTQAGEFGFTQRLIISTTDKWGKNAEAALDEQTIPTSRLRFQDLKDAPIDWNAFKLEQLDRLERRPPKTLFPHQEVARQSVLSGFAEYDRGKLIMACGTGKTFVSLRTAEAQVPAGGMLLFLAPSISLVSQSLREWTAEADQPLLAFVVCSDTKVGKDDEDISIHDLAYPATTDPHKLYRAIDTTRTALPNRRLVIFCTYQSITVISAAQKLGLGPFDLIVCDEAHRTTGLTLPNETLSDFVAVHDNAQVQAHKRLYMTATPRIYGEASKTKADEKNAVLYSMDDESKFGPDFYRLNFGKALDQDLLTEYKVLIVAVDDARMANVVNNYNNTFKLDNKTGIHIDFATRIIGSWKGLSKQGLVLLGEDGTQQAATEDIAPMRRAVAFSNSIKASRQTTEVFDQLASLYADSHGDDTNPMVQCQLKHVDGTMNALVRQDLLNWLRQTPPEGECRILSNARCLSEGIDVPALDAVVFFDTRDSIVDIVQSVGRVMRKAKDKRYGYIILPVCLPSSHVADYNAYIESNPQFKGIWKVLKALRAHDESLVDEAEFRRKIKVLRGGGGGNGGGGRDTQLDIEFPAIPLDDLSDAVYAAIPRKLGDREYWSEWAKSISINAERLISRIKDLIVADYGMGQEFAIFLKGLQDTLNPAVTADEAIEMLAQHILTLPVFQALFAGSDFPENNAVAKALQAIVQKLDTAAVASETEGLAKFYENIRERISLAKSDKSKQDIIRNLYDTFFNNAFPRMAARLGIVYTPTEVVDFILHSVQAALSKHFNCNIGDKDVQLLDPFSGTGTFFVRLIQSGLISKEDLPHKYSHELHANEIVLLAYYIATVNIETAYHGQMGTYLPFTGMVLTDTFQMTEQGDLVDKLVMPENNAKAEHQLAQPIRVILGNPPYSAGQETTNDNNQNLPYPTLDARIRDTYAARSSATNKNSLYDSYIRSIRWASDRIRDKGIVAFVTNGSFLDANNMDGLRKCLTNEFSYLYVFNLRGNARTSGEERRQEGGGIFDSGSRTPVAITILVKDPAHAGPCQLHYYDIGDYLTREDKLERVVSFGNIDRIDWQRLCPNTQGDWINQRDPVFDTFVPLGEKDDKSDGYVFMQFSNGLQSNRDNWVLNYSRLEIASNIRKMIATYNMEIERYNKFTHGMPKDQWPDLAGFIVTDPKKISWTSSLIPKIARGIHAIYSSDSIAIQSYRPYSKQWVYFDDMMIHRIGKWKSFFPTQNSENIVISTSGVGASKAFSASVTDAIADVHHHANCRCFPLYWYEKFKEDAKAPQAELSFDATDTPDADGYIRHDAITDWALSSFQDQFQDQSISKEDIFWYVYGILHSPEYKQRFASDLKKMLPRIPYAQDFWAFSKAGRELGGWHLNYETVEPWPVIEVVNRMMMERQDYRVTKMIFGKKDGKPDKTVIIYNSYLTLREIPLDAYQYVVNGKSAIDWIMERYAITVDKASGIRNDPNDWSDDSRYIVDLLKRIVRVSLETVKIVNALPPLNEAK